MAGNTVRLSGLRAEVAGGKLIGQALAAWDEDNHPQVYFDLAARDMQLASLEQVQGMDLGGLSGQVNVLLAGEIKEGKPHIVGRTQVGNICLRDITVEQATGLWELREDAVHLRLVRISDPTGQIWVQGDVSRERGMNLKVNAAELDLAAWGEQLGRPGLRGVAFMRASVAGNLEDLTGAVELIAFGVGSQQFSTDALCARATIGQSAVALDELLIARGLAMVAGSGRLGGLSMQAQQMPVAADLKVVGFGLQEIGDHLGLDPPLSGVGEIGVTLSGTISLKVAGAAISLEGYLDGWQQLVAGRPTKPEFALQLSAENIDLQSIISPEETDVQIAGRVDLPEIVIRSSPQGPVGQAHLLVPHLVIGNQQVSAIDTMILVGQGKVSLQDTTLQIAGAQVQAGGDYHWEQQQVRAHLQLLGGRIGQLLHLAAPVSELISQPPAAQKLSRQLRGLALRAVGDIDLAIALEGAPGQMMAYLQTELTELSFDQLQYRAVAAMASRRDFPGRDDWRHYCGGQRPDPPPILARQPLYRKPQL
jgi:hypothetical protein